MKRLVIVVASAVAFLFGEALDNAGAKDRITENSRSMECLQAPTPACLFAVARESAGSGGPEVRKALLPWIDAIEQIAKREDHPLLEIEGGIWELFGPNVANQFPRQDFPNSLTLLVMGDEEFVPVETNAELGSPAAKAEIGIERQIQSAASPTPMDPYQPENLRRAADVRSIPSLLERQVMWQVASGQLSAAVNTARLIGGDEYLRMIGLIPAGGTSLDMRRPDMEMAEAVGRAKLLSGEDEFIAAFVDLAGEFARHGREQEARSLLPAVLKYSDRVKPGSHDQGAALGALASVQAHLGEVDAALATARMMRTTCCRGLNEAEKRSMYSRLLRSIAEIQLDKGDVRSAENIANAILTPEDKVLLLARTAIVAARSGEKIIARALVDTAQLTAREIEHQAAAFEVLSRLAAARDVVGQRPAARALFQKAFELATHANDGNDVITPGDGSPDSTYGPQRMVIAEMIGAGDFEEALKFARRMPLSLSGAFRDMAVAHAALGNLDEASRVLAEGYARKSWARKQKTGPHLPDRSIAFDGAAVPVLARIAVLQAERGDRGAALETIRSSRAIVAPLQLEQTNNEMSDRETRRSWCLNLIEIAKAEDAIGEADSAQKDFQQAVLDARLIGDARTRTETLIAVAEAMANSGRTDEAPAVLYAARTEAEWLMNYFRDPIGNSDISGARDALQSIAKNYAAMGMPHDAFETVVSLVDHGVLASFSRLPESLQQRREAVMGDVAILMAKAGRLDEATKVLVELKVPSVRASVLPAIARLTTPGDFGRGQRVREMLDQAAELLIADAPRLDLERLMVGRATGYARLAVAEHAHGNHLEAHTFLDVAHSLADQIQFTPAQVSALLSIAAVEDAMGDEGAVGNTLAKVRQLADGDDATRLLVYPYIILTQARLQSWAAARDTLLHMFSLYPTPIGGTEGTVRHSVLFPVTIAALMVQLGVEKFDAPPLPASIH